MMAARPHSLAICLIVSTSLLAFSLSSQASPRPDPRLEPRTNAEKTTDGGAEPSPTGTSAQAATARLEASINAVVAATNTLQTDPPAQKDLDAAERALGELKSLIDEGAALEPKDLEYAKTALKARKTLREKRTYVDDKRSKAEIFEAWRKTKTSVDPLLEAAANLEKASAPSASELDRLEALIKKATDAIKGAPASATNDKAFRDFIDEAKKGVARTEKMVEAKRLVIAAKDAKTQLDRLRADLTKAMSDVRRQNPSEAVFERADKVVSQIEETLSGAKAVISKDANFAGYAKDVAREAKEARKTIDETWSATGLERLKAEIEPARSELIQAASALSQKDPREDRIAEARTACIVVRKLLDKFKNVTTRSQVFGRYASEVRGNLVEVERQLQLLALAPFESSVSKAVSALSARTPTDADLSEADSLTGAVRGLLAQGARLESEDKNYATYARKLRDKTDELEKKISETRRGAVLQREADGLKKASKDLSDALDALKGKRPTDAQFDEANTALIVLKKSIEQLRGGDKDLLLAIKHDRSAGRILDEATFLARRTSKEIEKRRLEVEVERQRSLVEDGRSEIASLMKQTWGRNVPEERLSAVEAAISKVKSLLEKGSDLARKDRGYAAYHREAKKRMDEADRQLATRRDELKTAQAMSGTDPILKEVVRALDTERRRSHLDAAKLDALDAKLKDAETSMTTSRDLERSVSDYRKWASSARQTISAAKKQLAQVRLALRMRANKSDVDEALASAKSALEMSLKIDATPQDVEAVTHAVGALQAALKDGRALGANDRAHNAALSRSADELAKVESQRQFAAELLTFRKRMSDDASGAETDLAETSNTKDLKTKKQRLESALHHLQDCKSAGAEAIEALPKVSTMELAWGGEHITTKDFVARCDQKFEEATASLKAVTGLIAFEKGPKRSSEAAKQKLKKAESASGSEAKKLNQEALELFEECISSGKILEYSNPELKDRTFEVSGRQISLSDLVIECTAEGKRLRGR